MANTKVEMYCRNMYQSSLVNGEGFIGLQFAALFAMNTALPEGDSYFNDAADGALLLPVHPFYGIVHVGIAPFDSYGSTLQSHHAHFAAEHGFKHRAIAGKHRNIEVVGLVKRSIR